MNTGSTIVNDAGIGFYTNNSRIYYQPGGFTHRECQIFQYDSFTDEENKDLKIQVVDNDNNVYCSTANCKIYKFSDKREVIADFKRPLKYHALCVYKSILFLWKDTGYVKGKEVEVFTNTNNSETVRWIQNIKDSSKHAKCDCIMWFKIGRIIVEGKEIFATILLCDTTCKTIIIVNNDNLKLVKKESINIPFAIHNFQLSASGIKFTDEDEVKKLDYTF